MYINVPGRLTKVNESQPKKAYDDNEVTGEVMLTVFSPSQSSKQAYDMDVRELPKVM